MGPELDSIVDSTTQKSISWFRQYVMEKSWPPTRVLPWWTTFWRACYVSLVCWRRQSRRAAAHFSALPTARRLALLQIGHSVELDCLLLDRPQLVPRRFIGRSNRVPSTNAMNSVPK
jgi:hypothetical protein